MPMIVADRLAEYSFAADGSCSWRLGEGDRAEGRWSVGPQALRVELTSVEHRSDGGASGGAAAGGEGGAGAWVAGEAHTREIARSAFPQLFAKRPRLD